MSRDFWVIKNLLCILMASSSRLDRSPTPRIPKVSKFDNPRIMRWVLALQSFVFRVEHIKSEDNVGADFRSGVIF